MTSTFHPKTTLRNSQSIPYNGSMAPLLRSRKYLECFYCGKRSTVQYDGSMTRWDCKNCDSTNFLDQNGQITDPPVATDSPVSRNVQYAIARPNSPPRLRTQESSLFCNTCLKNQHLFAASIAQYDVELDTRDPNYRQKEKEFFAYRRRLEKTYPQVCQDCEPRVQSRLREAGMTAKADHLRRMMDKSRARRSQKGGPVTSAKLAEKLGRSLWFLGLFGQISWDICGVLPGHGDLGADFRELEATSSTLWTVAATLTETCMSDRWVQAGLFCSTVSIWWNPMFYQMRTGFVNHIAGFGNWYKFQVLMIMTRCIFYFVIRSNVLAQSEVGAEMAAHMVMLVFILLLGYRANQSLRVDLTPLWQSTNGNVTVTEPANPIQAPIRQSTDLADILDSIAATPAKQSNALRDARIMPSDQTPNHAIGGHRPLALAESPLSTGPRSSFKGIANSLSSQTLAQYTKSDEMDWEAVPAQPSPPRAFRPLPISGEGSHSFNHAPASDKSNPFWYKLPAMPKSQAENIWNPPQEPKLHTYSPEVKENYFNTLTKKNLTLKTQTEANSQDMKIQPPKFFAPSAKSEVGTSLANLLTSISLEPVADVDEDEPMEMVPVGWTFRWDHVGQCVALLLGLWFWQHAFKRFDENTNKVLLTILSGCVALGARTLVNSWLLLRAGKAQVSRWAGLVVGVVEVGTALWAATEVIAGRVDRENFSSLGTILIGGMVLQEFWYASFG